MGWRLWPLILAVALAACAGGPPSCRLTRMGSIPLDVRGGVPMATVTVNGTPLRLILDTGAQVTVMTPEAAARARLGVDPQLAPRRGIGGGSARHFVRVDDASAGNVHFPPFIGAMGDFGVASLDGAPFDGMLGADVLAGYDVDLDLPANTATLYAGRLCDPRGIPWGVAPIPLATFGRTRARDARLYLPVTVNGTGLTAVLDSGASHTVVPERDAASIAGPRERIASPGPIHLVGFGTAQVAARFERVGMMSVGPGRFGNWLLLIDDGPEHHALLGDDYIGHRRVWLSFSSGRIFVDRPGPP